jgi:flagellar L-ring protein precursor FlgH
MKGLKKLLLVSSLLTTVACANTMERIEEINSGPKLAQVQSPADNPNYKPITNWPAQSDGVPPRTANSLWQQGSRSFFKDQRATRVGDILTVVVKISDKAALNNSTSSTRSNNESLDAGSYFGLEDKIGTILPGDPNLPNLVDYESNRKISGGGTIGRKEDIETRIAAIITQVLPNGNLALKGTQQVRVNHELREVAIEGVIRPEDISSDNTIQSEQIAEARISYGGRGTISYANQPRYGSELIDIISPF